MSAIWEKHRQGVLERVSLIERAVSALIATELDEPQRALAQHAAHTLVGSVGTFGFLRASAAARGLERELADPAPDRAQAISALVVTVRRELQGEALTQWSEPRAQPTADGGRVLIVDDDLQLCERIAAEAAARGRECDIAISPQQARSLLAERPPVVVLLDLTFPPDGMADAYALMSELTSASPAVAVLVLTGSDAFTDRVEAARRGSRGFLPKSLLPSEIIDAIDQHIEGERLTATRVLVVDDDPALLEVMRTLLEPHGLEVFTLADPLRFWDTLEQVMETISAR